MWSLFMHFEMWCDYVLLLKHAFWTKYDHYLRENQNVNCVKSNENTQNSKIQMRVSNIERIWSKM